MIHLRKSRVLAILALAVMLLLTVSPFAVAADIDLTDADVASEYLDFGENLAKALETKRADIPAYSTWLSLLPPIIAIALALITKEVYSSLFIGITAGALMYAKFNFSATIDHLFVDLCCIVWYFKYVGAVSFFLHFLSEYTNPFVPFCHNSHGTRGKLPINWLCGELKFFPMRDIILP